jgi:SsrA-binding protein
MASKSGKNQEKSTPTAVNKKAYHNYELIDRFEAGIELLGSEVKSLRAAAADLTGSYARIIEGQCYLVGAKIAPYQNTGYKGHEPARKRKLLLHKAQILKITNKLEQRGFTFIPLKIYFNNRGLAKIELALAKGKRQYDKRQTLSERRQKRDIDRDMKKYKRR